MINVASNGDVRTVRSLHRKGGMHLLNSADYDGRTALHLACAEGQRNVVGFFVSMVEQGAELAPVDRWGFTPLMEAQKFKHDEVAQMLQVCRRRTRRAAVAIRPRRAPASLRPTAVLPPPAQAALEEHQVQARPMTSALEREAAIRPQRTKGQMQRAKR